MTKYLNEWSNTAGSNNATVPDGWPEGMTSNQINNTARETLAVISRWEKDNNGSVVTTGTQPAYLATLNQSSLAAYYDGLRLCLDIHATNASATAPTLNVNSIGAKALTWPNATAVAQNELVLGMKVDLVYDGTQFQVISIGGKNVIGTDVQAYDATLAGIAADTTPVATNLIINGGFQVNQRVYVSGTATADGTYMHDRWRSATADSSYTFATASPASPQTVTIAANDSIEQVIEGANIGTAGTHTISWTGTATARAVVNTQTTSGNFAVSPITVTAVLDQVITVEFTGADAAGGSTIATNTGTLGKVQCELGGTATAFAHEDYSTVLAKCQRYYTRWDMPSNFGPIGTAYNSQTSVASFGLIFPVIMRDVPTLDVSAVGDFEIVYGALSISACTGITLSQANTLSGIVEFTATGTPLTTGEASLCRSDSLNANAYFALVKEL